MKKRVLITGGSGFLGRNLALRLKDKYDVYLGARNNKQNRSVGIMTGCEIMPLDISNIESVRDMFREVKPDIVIHAAATKFVDLSEKYPMETVDVNVVGSQNVARVAIENGVETVIGISTDKATPPIRNIYGMSKSTMERMFCLMDGKSSTRFVCVRYGNVVWSTGSVFPVWKEMYEKNGKVGTTGPEMRRFFFTVNHAIDLVETAIDNIDTIHGHVLSRVMKAAKIENILKVWAKYFNCEWEYIAGRPGERNDEYLVGDIELEYCREVDFNGVKHFLIHPNNKVETPYTEIFGSHNAEELTEDEIIELIESEPTHL